MARRTSLVIHSHFLLLSVLTLSFFSLPAADVGARKRKKGICLDKRRYVVRKWKQVGTALNNDELSE